MSHITSKRMLCVTFPQQWQNARGGAGKKSSLADIYIYGPLKNLQKSTG